MFTQLIAHEDLTAFTYVIKVIYTCCIKDIRMPNSVVCRDAAHSVYRSSSWPLLFENCMLIKSFDDYLTEGNLCHHEIIHNSFPANLSLNWVKKHTHTYIYTHTHTHILSMHACVQEKKFAHNDRKNIDTVKNVVIFMPYISLPLLQLLHLRLVFFWHVIPWQMVNSQHTH
jgi:hypothetical protein